MNTCIIIPCFNEFERLPQKEFIEFIEKNNIYFTFINDGSTDNTQILLESLKEKFKTKINIIQNKNNVGKAESVRIGVLDSLKRNIYDYIGFFDADLATPLSEISELLNILENSDDKNLVLGSRIKRLGSNIDRKFSRFLFGRFFATIVSEIILNMPIYDTQCGAKIFSKNIALDIFQDKFVTKWIFDVEILLRLKIKYGDNFLRNNVVEFPLNYWIEKGGSKIKLIEFLKVPGDLVKLKINYKKK